MARLLLFSTNPIYVSCTRGLATQNSTISRIQRNVEKEILPPRPKKPSAPFLQFLHSSRAQLEKEFPDLQYKDIVKKASERWAHIEPTIKQNLQKQYSEQQSAYKQKLSSYMSSITDDQKISVKNELIKRGYAWEKDQTKQKLVELGKPKKPLTAFFLFMQDKRITKDTNVSYKDWISNVSNEWKNTAMETKNKYMTKATQLVEQHKIDMKKWEEDMIRMGHNNLLKSKSNRRIDVRKDKE